MRGRSSSAGLFHPRYPFGTVIAAEGTPTDALYVIVSGRARVVKKGSDGGDEIPLNVLRAGDSFGEAELLDGTPRPTTVRASTDVLALRLDGEEFRALVDAHPDIRTYLELQLKHATLQRFFRNVPSFNRLSAGSDGRRRARGAPPGGPRRGRPRLPAGRRARVRCT